MKNVFIAIILSISLLGCEKDISIQPTSVCTNDNSIVINPIHPKGAKIQAIVDKYIDLGIPGANVLINDDDGFWISSGGYADIANNIEMEACYITKLGSITKMMFGTLTWLQVQEGKININDPISNYIPDVAGRITNGREITVAMLLNHTSGIYDVVKDLNFNLAMMNDFSKSWSSEELLKYIENKPALFEPGEKVKYCNSNTLIEALILEEVTGKTQLELLQEYIFNPLGMENTVYYNYSTEFPKSNLAQGYIDFYNEGGSIQNISNLNPGSGNGYTGVYSTVSDLYKYMNALLREKELINPTNLDEIFNSFRPLITDEQNFNTSIGAIHDDKRSVLPTNIHAYGHEGDDVGYCANLDYFPHNNTIFAATYNYGRGLPTELGDLLDEFRNELFLVMAE